MRKPAITTPEVPASAWAEWKNRCTIEKCCPETTRQLAAFGRSRLYIPLSKLSRDLAREYCDSETPGTRTRAWLSMEMHLFAGRNPELVTQDEKSYKDLLLARCQEPARIESNLSVTFHTIARRIAYEEGLGARIKNGQPSKRVKICSLDAPYKGSDSTLHDSIADNHPGQAQSKAGEDEQDDPASGNVVWDGENVVPADDTIPEAESILVEPETNEDYAIIQRKADRLAADMWKDFTDQERLIITLLARGLTRADMHRSGRFKCKQSQLYACVGGIFKKIRTVDWGCPLNDRSRAFLTRPLFYSLTQAASKWLAASEKQEAVRSIVP